MTSGMTADGGVVFVNTRFNCLATASGRPQLHAAVEAALHLADRRRGPLPPERPGHGARAGRATSRPSAAPTPSTAGATARGRWRHRHRCREQRDRLRRAVHAAFAAPARNGKLWLLNSGTGELGCEFEPGHGPASSRVAFCPGFVRGLAFHGKYAFVGLSKPRYQRFEGLALDQRLAETEFRALVRRPGHRPDDRRLRAVVPHRWRGGRTL